MARGFLHHAVGHNVGALTHTHPPRTAAGPVAIGSGDRTAAGGETQWFRIDR